VISLEQVDFHGRPALHAIIEGGTPELHIETWALDANGVFFSLRAVSVGSTAAVPHEDFARFFDGLEVVK
jgi:hypothetical protein